MKKKTTKTEGNFPLALVDWEDAWTSPTDVFSEEEVLEQPIFIVQSSGILVRNDKAGVSLAKDRFVSTGDFRGILHIPRAMVRKVTLL